jgi:hypothetical protein
LLIKAAHKNVHSIRKENNIKNPTLSRRELLVAGGVADQIIEVKEGE